MATAAKNVDRVKAQARSKWDKLTDEDFDSIKTNVIELATRLQARYGFTAEEAKKEAQEFMENVGDIASDAYDQAKDAAQTGYGHARDVAQDAYHAAADALDEAATRVDRVVKDNAWATVAGAVLLGGLIGYLVGYESRPRSRWY
jgi:ElaB/YqjD/DUF883 family membrane-anchored ribosome-binding protein